MAGRVRHLNERNGRYEARLSVPAKLRGLIDKSEFVAALGGDRREALKRPPEAVAKFRVAVRAVEQALEAGPAGAVTPEQPIVDPAVLALRHYRQMLRIDDEDRRQHSGFARVMIDGGRVAWLREASAGQLSDDQLDECVGDVIRGMRAKGRTRAEPGSREWRELAILVAAAELEAMRRFCERDEGDYSGALKDARLIAAESVVNARQDPTKGSTAPVPTPVSLRGLFDRWRLVSRGGEAEETGTDRRYRPVLRDFIAFLGHDDATLVTNGDIGRWIEHLLTVKRKAAKTVKDVDLAVIKGLFRWAGENGHVPRLEITAKVGKRRAARTHDPGFSDEEAARLLTAATAYRPDPDSRESIFTTRARRWAPWLCALTGARISEMMQLRVEDVRERDGIPFLLVTPDAGSVKTTQFREVPLHPRLAEIGFHDLVREQKSGALFYDDRSVRSGSAHPAKIVAGRVSERIRSLGILPEDIQPSHGWRHRFRTVARDLKLDARVVDDILGHAPSTAGETCGTVSLKIEAETIAAMPAWPGGRVPVVPLESHSLVAELGNEGSSCDGQLPPDMVGSDWKERSASVARALASTSGGNAGSVANDTTATHVLVEGTGGEQGPLGVVAGTPTPPIDWPDANPHRSN